MNGLRRTAPNAVESEAFSVRRTSRYRLEYREGDRVLHVETEPGDGLAVYRESIRSWETPTGEEVVTQEEKARVLTNIGAGLDHFGIEYLIA